MTLVILVTIRVGCISMFVNGLAVKTTMPFFIPWTFWLDKMRGTTFAAAA